MQRLLVVPDDDDDDDADDDGNVYDDKDNDITGAGSLGSPCKIFLMMISAMMMITKVMTLMMMRKMTMMVFMTRLMPDLPITCLEPLSHGSSLSRVHSGES